MSERRGSLIHSQASAYQKVEWKKKLEWKLAQELEKLEQRRSTGRDEEFARKLRALVEEYQVDTDTVLSAARIA